MMLMTAFGCSLKSRYHHVNISYLIQSMIVPGWLAGLGQVCVG
jgi:hypothetical protein